MFLLNLLIVFISIICYLLLSRLGLGSNFPSNSLPSSFLTLNSSIIEIIGLLNSPPGNIAVSKSNRIFFTYHPEYKPKLKVVELILKQNNQQEINENILPFPSLQFQDTIVSCLSIRIDSLDRLWILDFSNHGVFYSPKIYSISLQNSLILSNYSFPSHIAGFGSMLNDFNISPDNRFIYIADTSFISLTPALIVFSIPTSTSFRLLSSNSLFYGLSTFLQIPPYQIKFGPFGMKINLDSIALTRDGEALYFSPFTNTNLLCLDTQFIYQMISCLEENERNLNKKEKKDCNEILKDKIEIV